MNQNFNDINGTYPPQTNMFNYINQNTSGSPNGNIEPQYAENLFTMNHNKKVTVYFSYPDSIEWRDRIFTGTILAAGRDYLLLRNDQGQTILLWLVYINYATFDEEISY